MNHCYRLVFNAASQVWQAVAETAKSHRKSSKAKTLVLTSLLLVSNAYADPATNALPTGGHVVAGQSVISQSGNQLNILQTTQKSIINWGSYNIGANSTVSYEQLNSSSISLNRILSSDPSQIFGKLNANGQVWLINPNGILFGKSAQVNVGGLLASTLNIADDDFLSGNYQFTGNSGSVVNMGSIVANNGGYVAMLAPEVRNEGVISALEGASVLAAGDAITMDFAGNGLINVQVDSANVNTLVENKHLIKVGGGQVIMSSKAADGLMTSVINNSGRIEADSMVTDGGTVRLTGAKTVINSGEISAKSSAGKGGNVHMLGEHVGVFDAGSINVNGKTGGGTILVGGDFQGKNGQVQNAQKTFVSQNAKLSADATDSGDGGKVIVWADDTTRFYGNISAKGGALSGNGGFVEVSGKKYLDYTGKIDVTAYQGIGGKVFFDPLNIVLNTTTQTAPSNNANGTPDIAFGDAPVAGTTTIQVADIVGYSEAFFQATNDITVASAITMAANNSIRLEAGNNITVSGAITTTGTGAVTLKADADSTGAGTLAVNAAIATDIGGATLSGASVTSTAAGTINTTGAANANGGNVSIAATGAVSLLGTITANGGTAAAANTGKSAGNVSIASASIQTVAITTNGSNGNGTNQAGGNAGAISLAATGNVTTTGTLQARTGSATGTGASGAVGSIAVTGSTVSLAVLTTTGQNNGNGGTITATASTALNLNGAVNSSGGTAITANAGKNAGAISLNGGTITAAAAATITANGSNGVGANQAGGNGAAVSLTGTGAISTRAITASGGNGVATNAAGGNAGSISIATNAGNITTNAAALTARTGIGRGTGANSTAGFVTINNTSASGTISTGAINTSGQANGAGGNVTLAGNNSVTVGGAINTNAGGVTGTRAGLKAGDVSISGGSITTTAGTISAIGSTAVGTNQNGGNAGAVSLLAAGTLAAGAINADGGNATGTGTRGFAATTTLTGSSMTIGALTVRSGTGAGTPSANHNITTTGAGTSTIASINATVNGALNMNIADTLTVTGVVQGTGTALTKTGAGTLVLSGANTYTGATNINAGTLKANNAAALGAVAGATTVANGATLNVNNVTLAAEAITLNGAGVGDAGALTGTDTANVSGAVTTVSDSRIGSTSAASTLNLTGVVMAANNLGIVGAGSVTATNAANNFSTVNINGAKNVNLRDANSIILGNGASSLTGNLSLQTAGAVTQTAGITVAGTTTLTAGAANNITLNNAANDFNSIAVSSGQDVNVVDANALTVNASSVRSIVAKTLSDNLTLGGNISATGAGDAIVLASAANFINASNSSLTPDTGRWLVYSASPLLDTRGAGLLAAYDFKQYNTAYGGVIAGTGDGFIYTTAPIVSTTLTGSATKVYDANTTAPIGSLVLNSTGAIDGDSVTLSGVSATYDNKNVGTSKTISVSGISVASADNGGKTVYGYQMASSTATGNVGTITPAPLTITANNASKLRGTVNPAFTSNISGFVGGETSAVLTGVLGHNTPAVTSSPAGSYAITPFGLSSTNYDIVFVDGVLTVNAVVNFAALGISLSDVLLRPEQAQQACGSTTANDTIISGLDAFGADDIEYRKSVSQPLVGGVVANALVSPACLKL